MRSEPGRGSCLQVRVYLPAVAGTPELTEDARIVGDEGPRRRVLVVDDHADTLRPLSRELSEAEHVVETRRAAAAAARRLRLDG